MDMRRTEISRCTAGKRSADYAGCRMRHSGARQACRRLLAGIILRRMLRNVYGR